MARYRNRGRNRSRRVAGYIIIILTIGILGYGFYYWQTVVMPALDSIAEIKAEAMIAEIVTKAMNEQFQAESDATQLLMVSTNGEGQIEMVQSNTRAINLLVTELVKEIEERYVKLESIGIEVPFGSILGSKLLSQFGPDVALEIHPISVVSMDFRTEFESEGINQTKYKVYVILESRAKVVAPFSSNTLEVKNTVLIAEAVILGKVPQSYVVVPEEDILDVTDE